MKKCKQHHPHTKHIYAAFSLVLVGIIAIGANALLAGSGRIAFKDHIDSMTVRERQSYIGSLMVASFDVPFREHLKAIKIEPRIPGGISLMPNETIRLTSVGLYSSWEQKIQANWFLLRHGFAAQSLNECQGRYTCNYTAGSAVESLDIQAESAGKKASVTINITGTSSDGFTDSIPDWASDSIHSLNTMGIIHGYADGRYGAADSLTQGQMITLLYRTILRTGMEAEPTSCREFSSLVPEDHYAYLPLCLFRTRDWDTDWNFDPNLPISRAETAAYIYTVFGEKLMDGMDVMQGAIYIDGQIFTDVPADHARFYEISVSNKTAIMTGNPDGSFGPDRTLNRAEAAIIMHRLLNQVDWINTKAAAMQNNSR